MDNEKIENQEVALVSKHCPNAECPLYMLPQPKRTYCIECDSELVY